MNIDKYMCGRNILFRTILFTIELPHPYNKIGDGPEGPEVRVVSDKLRACLVGKTITGYYLGERAKATGFNNLKCPTIVTSVHSYGKKVMITLDSDYVIIISLGMVGRLQYVTGKHSHVHFHIGTNELQEFILYFDDYRYMGGVDIIHNDQIPIYFNKIGPDVMQLALEEGTWMSQDVWMNIFNPKRVSRRMIADILTDQSFVSGIGNYLMAEILYYSSVHPRRRGGDITYDEWNSIRINTHKVMALSYSYGGLTIKDFISPDGERGLYPNAVYGKPHDPLGNRVLHEHLTNSKNSRTIHYVIEIQK